MQKEEVFERTGVIEKVKPFLNTNIIKVFTGQRRVGKSFAMKQIADYVDSENANIIFIDLEQFRFSKIKTDAELYDFIESKIEKGKENYLFIDEIQNVHGFENVLRNYISTQECEVFVTGSNAKMLSGDLATFIAGRYIEIPVHALSYREFLEFHKRNDSDESLMDYLHFGGLPFLIHIELTEENVFQYLSDVYSTVLVKDIVQRENIRNIEFLQTLASYIADNVGSLFSANNISKYLKSQNIQISTPAIISYLNAFCNAHLIHRAQRADVCGLKIFESGEKYYFEDLGLRNALVGYDFQKDAGKLVENAVFNHLLRLGFDVFVGKLDDKEVDFIAKKANRKIYVQASYLVVDEKTTEREMRVLESINDNYPKYIVCMNPLMTHSNTNGIEFYHLRTFLLKEDF